MELARPFLYFVTAVIAIQGITGRYSHFNGWVVIAVIALLLCRLGG